jgi:hypothetical protein
LSDVVAFLSWIAGTPPPSPTFAFSFCQVTGQRHQQRFFLGGHMVVESQECALSPLAEPVIQGVLAGHVQQRKVGTAQPPGRRPISEARGAKASYAHFQLVRGKNELT